ncbi:MAG: fumarylacetoacetate hydrolase family protein [Gammaproteobacteria bacterium]|jgi:2-keto-4-pentenoate hydratase/2-oxohepta-3-ene-1,7-dioic acid hydratase in catechol pathway|nr:fumarylacetoacetate hydrolase family protein [Gammaproteobacteria bacterium]
MKLARIGAPGDEQPAIVAEDGSLRSLAGIVADITGDTLLPEKLEQLLQINTSELPVLSPGSRYGPCVGAVSQFICVGLNYADHAKEARMEVPDEPILFMKSPSAICGPNDDIVIPRGAEKTDWEVELGIVIGSPCSNVPIDEARKYIAGFCVTNDLSERAFQFEGTGQWVKGKSADTFGPIGPWLVTKDEVENVQNLGIWLKRNGEKLQDSNTGQMIFGVDVLVSFISRYMTLQPGAIISSGTPFGTGFGFTPPIFLRVGDRLQLGIQGLGEQSYQAVA